MNRMMLWGGLSLLAAASCADNEKKKTETCDEKLEQIEHWESQLFLDNEEPQAEVRDALLVGYADFANACSGRSEVAEMLFRRADLLRSKGAFEEAITQLRDVHDHFPQYPYRARCAFLVGFIAETELGDREQARLTYRQVLEVHPDSEEAEWARISLEQLDLRATDLLRTFQRNGSD